MLCYTHRSVSCLASIRETTFCRTWGQNQTPTKEQSAERDLEYSALNGMSPPNPSPRGSGNLIEKDEKSTESEVMEGNKETRPYKHSRTNAHYEFTVKQHA